MTRINKKFTKLYSNGVELSGYASDIGPLDWKFDAVPNAAMSDGVMNAIAGRGTISAGSMNAFLDNDTAGLFALASAAQGTQNVLVAFGTNAVPVAGNPVFAWTFEQSDYQAAAGDGFVPVSVPVSAASYASTLTHKKPWGILIHPNGVETAVNTAIGLDDLGASSALGGIFVYQLHSSDGTVALKMQDAATNLNASFSDLSGATSGNIDATTTPTGGMVALGVTATVRRYLRWQLVFGTATTATFTIAFIRN